MDKPPRNWFALAVTVARDAAEAIEFAMNELEALGTEINNLGKVRSENLCVIGYFNEKPGEENVRFQISDALRIYGFGENALNTIEWSDVEDRDWLVEWKKHWKPTEIGRFIIAPPWEPVPATEKIVIRIEPNMAFGTGTHETTQLCLKKIGEIFQPDQTFLDVGTGTGILAIAVGKLSGSSAAKIIACDTDADSVKIARENAIANGVSDRIEFFDGPIDDNTRVFDFVCANLTIDVIVPILPLLIKKTSSVLLLSGILVIQKDEIAAELQESQISDFSIDTDGEWLSVTVNLQ